MERKESANSYRNILKGTSIFGGVQIFQILINLVRGKFVAMFLGPEGMGIASLFTSSSNTLQRFSSLGLNLAVVKEVASGSEESPEESGRVQSTVRRLITFTSLLGCVLCVALCVPLSRLTFGDTSMWWQFMMLGIAVGLGISSSAKLAVLQGLHQVKPISKASIVGGLTGLVIGVPLYYFFGDKGIVPAMIALALSIYVFYTISLKKCEEYRPSVFSWKENMPLVKKLIGLGIILMASDLIGTAVTYGINLFVRTFGSVDMVGLYQAANSVTNQYSGLVFAAMAMDYFPRLSRSASNNVEMCAIVNRQTEIVSLIIAPAMTLLILTAPLIIRILLTESFMPVLPLMRWFGLGVLLKALAFPMGYIAFAKGNKKLFFWLEGVTGNLLTFLTGCLFFYFFGLMGLGYALVADNALCIIIYYVVNRKMYGYRFTNSSLGYACCAIAAGGACWAFAYIENYWLSLFLMACTVILSAGWSVVRLRDKIRN